MFGEFPLGRQWAAALFAEVLPRSRVRNIHPGHAEAVASQLVRVIMNRSGQLGDTIHRVIVAYGLLDRAWDADSEQIARIVDRTFQHFGELQEREFAFENAVRTAPKEALEAKFGSLLELFRFTQEQYYRTLIAPYVAADAITRTYVPAADLIDGDDRVTADVMRELEDNPPASLTLLTQGLNRHLRNSAAHNRHSVQSDDLIRLWDMNPAGRITWGPVEWKFWDLRTNAYTLSNTCSVLLLGLGMFDIAYGPTMRARGWVVPAARPRPKRRDIAKSELLGMAGLHGFTVEEVKPGSDDALEITLQVKGDTVIEQDVQIMTSGGGAYQQHVRTEWGPLRSQVYGVLQTTFDVHGGYDMVRVKVVASDGKTSLGEVDMPVAERQAMINGKEPAEAIRARLPKDTLADEKIPVVIKNAIVPNLG